VDWRLARDGAAAGAGRGIVSFFDFKGRVRLCLGTYKTQTTLGFFSSWGAVMFAIDVAVVEVVFSGLEMWRGDWDIDEN
jgi:hypothetical protein